jgi:thioredoxin-like negative regulator of GroEL
MKQLYYISADWCSPCQQLGPIMNQAASQGVQIQKVNIDHEPAVATRFNVRSVPTVILVENGKEKARFVGVRSLKQVIDFYNQ